jgi:ribosome-associated toxin RatA of RatAB toxin-antitoxin module
MPTLSRNASGTVDVAPEVAFQVLTDYDAYSEWMPFLSKGTTLAVEGDLAIAEFDLTGRGNIQVECMHSPGRQVLVRPLGRDITLHKLDWRLSPSGAGCQVDLQIEYRVTSALFKPATWRLLNASQMVKALQRQCSAFGSDGDSSGSMLDLMETPNGLVLVYNGKRYVCKPEEEKA